MKKRLFGNIGFHASEVGLGCWQLGGDCWGYLDDSKALGILQASVESGVNFLDTADVYGPDGLSERIIGRWFEADRRRDEVVLATKFGFRVAPGPLGTGAARRRVMRCAEDSLRRLNTDRIDLYQVHV